MSTLDANRTQVGSDEDDSKLMLLEDEGTESQRLLSYDGTDYTTDGTDYTRKR